MFSMLTFHVAHCMNGEDAKSEQVQICLRFWDFRITLQPHSSKFLTIQQGLSRGVSSIGNPRGPLRGFNLAAG